jgi:hypothetical protein
MPTNEELEQEIEDLRGKVQVLENEGDQSAAESLRNRMQLRQNQLNERLRMRERMEAARRQ